MKNTDTGFYLQTSVLETLASSTCTVGTSLVAALVTMVGLPVYVAVQAYQLTCGATIFLSSQAHAISVKVHDESKGTVFETVIVNMTGMKDGIITLVRNYVRK